MDFDLVTNNRYRLTRLNRINIILGKNGAGKSNLLRDIDNPGTLANNQNIAKVKYITPERGGVLTYEPNIELNMIREQNYHQRQLRANQFSLYKEQTVAQYRTLETVVLREIEKDLSKRNDNEYSFDTYINKINKLLDNIEIRRESHTFKIYNKRTGEDINPSVISSGESELIALAIECLVFQKTIDDSQVNILCMDEPDVHIHPDLQVKLMELLQDISINTKNLIIIICTHSTAIIGAFANNKNVNLAFKLPTDNNLEFKGISETYKKVLPVFGAHPLSNIFNQAPLFLVEGESDERIWQKAIKSSNGKITLYPCSTDSKDQMNHYEVEAQKIMKSVYDTPIAYSLRDGDNIEGEIDDLDIIIRLRLKCKSSENLLITDEVLASLNSSWENLRSKIDNWLNNQKNSNLAHWQSMNEFKASNYDRKNFDIKAIRNDLMYLLEKETPWEIAIGKVIGTLKWDGGVDYEKEGSIYSYLGKKLVEKVLPHK